VRELRVRRQRPEAAHIDAAPPAVQPHEAAGTELGLESRLLTKVRVAAPWKRLSQA